MAKSKQNITAIIYDKRGRVLAIGKNNYFKTHPLQAKYANNLGLHAKMFLHAEIDAIAKCKKLDKAHKIFISRIDKKGLSRLAKPCIICQSAIELTNIKKVEYTTN
jgi:tRNA(Arg) A34 adenosine deaminase TadA